MLEPWRVPIPDPRQLNRTRRTFGLRRRLRGRAAGPGAFCPREGARGAAPFARLGADPDRLAEIGAARRERFLESARGRLERLARGVTRDGMPQGERRLRNMTCLGGAACFCLASRLEECARGGPGPLSRSAAATYKRYTSSEFTPQLGHGTALMSKSFVGTPRGIETNWRRPQLEQSAVTV